MKKRIYASQLAFLLFFVTGELFFVLQHYVSQSSENERAVFLGFSLLRLATIIFFSSLILVTLGANIVVIKGNRQGLSIEKASQNPKARLFSVRFFIIIGAICWIVFFIPHNRFGSFKNYILVMKPLLLFGILLSSQIVVFILLTGTKNKNEFIKKFWQQNKIILLIWGGILIILTVLLGYIAFSKTGLLANNEDYWYEAGVPVLGFQILFGLVIGLFFWKGESFWSKKRSLPSWIDFVVFILIWIIGGLLWAQTSAPNGYLNPGPYPPTYETYPFADAARFDLMSQYALIGQGLNNGEPYNRPVYPAFLVYLHIFSGQDYEQSMQFQAALYGIFPAFIFFITKLLSNRGTGIAMATVMVLRGINGIAATNMINLANQKQMLTDFPTAIAVSVILLSCIIWLKKPQKLFIPLLIGGIFVITLYLRPTILGFLPAILLLPIFIKDYRWKTKAVIIGIFFIGIFTIIAPYEFKHTATKPNSTIKKITSTFDSRYPRLEEDIFGEETFRSEYSLPIIENHFFHNIVTSVLILPNTFTFENLRSTIKTENSYWFSSWNGQFSCEQTILLLLNLFLISLGFSISMRKKRLMGVLPLTFFLGYNLANALGRTSGGRYIVPVDWIIILYFVIGLFQICMWVFVLFQEKNFSLREKLVLHNESLQTHMSSRGIYTSVFFLFLAGALLIIPDFVFPKKFDDIEDFQLQQELFNYDLLGSSSYLEEFLEEDEAKVIIGQVMYPRYYQAGEGEFSFYFPYKIMEYPRLAFHLIGQNGTKDIIFAGSAPKELPNISSAIIVGCKEKGYIDAVAIILTDPIQRIYFREPLPDPICPISTP